jgi:hypothetical protein
MPFREKKAWATLVALLVVFIPYYYVMVGLYHQPDPDIPYLAHLSAIALAVFVGLEVLLILVARFLSPEDAGVPTDEREQLFAFRAARIAYMGLILFVIAVTFPMIHTYGGNWGWGMAYLGAILAAEMLRAIVLIAQYRRGY